MALACLRQRQDGVITVAIIRLKPDATPTGKVLEQQMNCGCEPGTFVLSSRIQRALKGVRVGHFRQKAFGEDFIDLSLVANEALNRRGETFEALTLTDLARRHGISVRKISQSENCAALAVEIFVGLYRSFILPEMIAYRGRYLPATEAHSVPLSPDDLSLLAAAPCLQPCPTKNVVAPQVAQRRAPWTSEEALDSALRYSAGASLSELSDLTGRSRQAILARLRLDGIVSRPLGHTS